MVPSETIHAVALAVGDIGLLVRGKSGSGKSGLAAAMMADWPFGAVRLVGDDRICLTRHGKRLLARPHPAIAGRLELRGFAIENVHCLDAVVVRGCVDLTPTPPDRLPEEHDRSATLLDIAVPCLRLAQNQSPFQALVTLWPYFRDQMMKV